MDAMGWIQLILFGGLLGILGQGTRVVVGLKKINDEAVEEHKRFGEVFDGRLLMITIFIGFVAGALATIALHENADTSDATAQAQMLNKLILPVLAAGYAGTDFIEGLVKKRLPK